MILSELGKETRRKSLIEAYIEKDLVCFTTSKTRNEVIRELCECLSKKKVVEDSKLFFDAVMKREQIVSTGIGFGIAIPHAKLEEIEDFFISIGISKDPIDWNSVDRNPVHIIVVIGGPASETKKYLQILSQVTLFLKDEKLRKVLLEAKCQEDVVKLFQGW